MVAIDDLVDRSPAIVEAFYPGGRGALGITLTLFGDNRWGKLPITIYPEEWGNNFV